MDQNPKHRVASARNVLFGKYETGRLLGQGTFAKVYYGKNIATGESVAVKVLNKDQVKKQGLIDQIKREISVMRLVRHPNVVELKEVMATKQKIYFVMEYVKGGELFAKVARGKLKEDLARKYFQQLISAIDYCHSRRVSHRDLKPENLLLDENGNLKVSDFGLSALPEQLRNDGLLHTQCGTPAYVAPEGRESYEHVSEGVQGRIRVPAVVFPRIEAIDFEDLSPRSGETDLDSRDNASAVVSEGPLPDRSRSQSKTMKSEDAKQEIEISRSKSSPPFYNAFEFISSMSSGFDLSSLFESKRRCRSMFTSKYSASAIMAKIETAARKLNFRVLSAKEFKVKMEGAAEGRKGKLAITAEVFEVAQELAVVEFSKSAGDTFEYQKFCEDDVRPALQDIVWSWQGESNCPQ
ncbi:CBL-interacting protein kinase 5 [Actinidia rufa]|uniref:non-specific serine/threonine protein kinase n=1 Tax=Actinidia rufa TaxID=165716 RepID=A0A7J0FZU6_9ERIC|nr:CBL-interacting protein kinase 5 [Actinidia rufa]